MEKYVDSRVSQQVVKVSVGRVVTLPADAQAYVKNTGSVNDIVLEFGIPRGSQGFTGATAPAIQPRDGVDGRHGLSAEEIQSAIAKAVQSVTAEFNKAKAELKEAAHDEIVNIQHAADETIAELRHKFEAILKSF